ncbi:hypothetical protein I4U23_012785 [Adineta vaga]|nr:hypothetical protein I4U23_012785 [Adineta vaga]
MKYFIQILIYLIFFLQNSNGIDDVLVMNDPSFIHKAPYEIITSNSNRTKRDQSSWFYPDIDKDQISCGQNVYVKLFTCSNLRNCRDFSSCLDSLRCPLSVKSNGGLILNLLRLLGIDKCNLNEQQNQLCSHDKRLVILKRLFAYWSHNKDNSYCHTISDFTNEIKKEVQDQCPINLRQVEELLENYSCLPLTGALNTLTSTTINVEKLPAINDPITTPETVISSQFAYIDEDNDLKFITSNKNFYNNTEQTVFVNDHHYYNVSYIIPKSEGISINFLQDNSQFVRIHALTNRHRSAFGIQLKFGFPFYGHTIHKILVATGGFIYTGDLLHSALIGSTQ